MRSSNLGYQALPSTAIGSPYISRCSIDSASLNASLIAWGILKGLSVTALSPAAIAATISALVGLGLGEDVAVAGVAVAGVAVASTGISPVIFVATSVALAAHSFCTLSGTPIAAACTANNLSLVDNPRKVSNTLAGSVPKSICLPHWLNKMACRIS